MGYSERICQLCGMSFNLGRIRTADEPDEAAWQYYGSDFISASPPFDECKAEGCSQGTRDEGNEGLALEHLAGPDCECTQGYAGSRITWGEMKERISVQCLAPKKEDWMPERGDEDFEISAQHCFLTGISSEPPDEFEATGLTPVRHGVADIMINNEADPIDDDGDSWAMPMHPACFQIFKRQSVAKTGAVDIDGLWKLREIAGDYATCFTGLPRPSDVELVNSVQNCECYRGTEYLAATPLNLVLLDGIIRGHMADEAGDTVFKAPASPAWGSDPFNTLSRELHLMLLPYLGIADVADLRLASRSFVQLPQSYFRHLIRTKMPWVWETESLLGKATDWHRLWNELAIADGGSGIDEKQRHFEHSLQELHSLDQRSIHDEIEAEQGIRPRSPRFSAAFQEKIRVRNIGIEAAIEAERESDRWLPKRQLAEIKGLRNRRRIWETVDAIVRRIGKLSPGERGDDPEEN